jgi:hypothetical protein
MSMSYLKTCGEGFLCALHVSIRWPGRGGHHRVVVDGEEDNGVFLTDVIAT